MANLIRFGGGAVTVGAAAIERCRCSGGGHGGYRRHVDGPQGSRPSRLRPRAVGRRGQCRQRRRMPCRAGGRWIGDCSGTAVPRHRRLARRGRGGRCGGVVRGFGHGGVQTTAGLHEAVARIGRARGVGRGRSRRVGRSLGRDRRTRRRRTTRRSRGRRVGGGRTFGCGVAAGWGRIRVGCLRRRVRISRCRAMPGVVATAAPMPNATASAPTRPMYLAQPPPVVSVGPLGSGSGNPAGRAR